MSNIDSFDHKLFVTAIRTGFGMARPKGQIRPSRDLALILPARCLVISVVSVDSSFAQVNM